MTKPSKTFTGKAGRHSMRARGFDGTLADRERIETQRRRKNGDWAIVSAAAACDRGLGRASPLHVLVLMGKYQNAETGLCIPAIEMMAAQLGITRRAVQQHIAKCIELKYLVAMGRRRATGGWTSNAYILLFPELTSPAPIPTDEPQNDAKPGFASDAKPSFVSAVDLPAVTSRVTVTDDQGMRSQASQGCEASLRKGCEASLRNSNSPPELPNELPSAEAARLREQKAAAAEGSEDIGTGRSDTEREAADHLPPRLVSHLRQLSKATGIAAAEFVAVVNEWRVARVSQGTEPAAALDFVSWATRRVPVSSYALDNLKERMTADLQARAA